MNRQILFFIIITSIFLYPPQPFAEQYKKEPPSIKISIIKGNLPSDSKQKKTIIIRLSVPLNHHAYLDKGKDGYFIPVKFDFSEIKTNGYTITPVSKPAGFYDKKIGATVLRGDGEYRFTIQTGKETRGGKTDQVFSLRSQICDDITEICYPPRIQKGSILLYF